METRVAYRWLSKGAFVLALTTCGVAWAGDAARVPEWRWVDEIAPASRTCGIEQGSMVSVITRRGDDYLVRYSVKHLGMGSECESGAVFFLPVREFDGMTGRYFEAMEEKRKTAEFVAQALASEPKGESK